MLTQSALFLLLTSTAALAAAFRYECTYSSMCSAEEGCVPTDFSINFFLDTANRSAAITGNLGVSEVSVHTGDRSITFLEFLGSGAVQSTTIQYSGESVHSRHTIIGLELAPSQYFGSCEVVE